MLDAPFFWNTSRKYIIGFSSLFKNLQIQKFTGFHGGSAIRVIDVPILFNGKNKRYYDLNRKFDYEENKISTILPRLGFGITSITSDPTRKTNNLNTHKFTSPDGSIEEFVYSGVPYNYQIGMSAWTKNIDDLFQIIEQVGSMFKPDHTISIHEIPQIGLTRNVSVLLESISTNIEIDYSVDSNRVVSADFDFTLKGMMYPPIVNSKIIKIINANLKDIDNDGVFANVNIDGTGEEIITTITE